MKIYIVIENIDAMGAVPRDMDHTIHGVFLDQKQAEAFVRGMDRYIHSYEKREVSSLSQKSTEKKDTGYFQIIIRDIG